MYSLIDNRSYNELKNDLQKKEIKPVILFYIEFSSKKNDKENISKLMEFIKKFPNEKKAIQIKIKSIHNHIQEQLSQLKEDFDILIGLGGLNKINRFFLESTKIDFLQDPQNSFFKIKTDFIHHFNSGMNQILLKFAKEKNIGILVTNYFLNQEPIIRGKEIGRISQNVIHAKKYGVNLLLNAIIKESSDIKTALELQKILFLLKADSNQIKQNENILENKININIEKKSEKYICEGIKII